MEQLITIFEDLKCFKIKKNSLKGFIQMLKKESVLRMKEKDTSDNLLTLAISKGGQDEKSAFEVKNVHTKV